MRSAKGFTLVELMIVVTIIGILASVAMPQYRVYIHRSEIVEVMAMSSNTTEAVTAHYIETLSFPEDNRHAGLPAPEKLISNRIALTEVQGGAIHITLGHKMAQTLKGSILTFRPAVVDDSPSSPISWLCGYDSPVPGMSAIGENRTNIPEEYLPYACREWESS